MPGGSTSTSLKIVRGQVTHELDSRPCPNPIQRSSLLLRRLTTYRVVVAALVALLAVVVVGNSPGTTVTDIKPEVYLAPGEMVA